MKKMTVFVLLAALISVLLLVSCGDRAPADTATDNAEESAGTTDAETEAPEETDVETDQDPAPEDTETEEVSPAPEEEPDVFVLDNEYESLYWVCTSVVTAVDGVVESAVNYNYNNDGELIGISGDERAKLTYDAFYDETRGGNVDVLEISYHDSPADLLWRFENGKMTKYSSLVSCAFITTYNYDDNGRLVNDYEDYWCGTIGSTDYFYDEAGNMVKKTVYVDVDWESVDDEMVPETTHLYTYTDDGRIATEEIEYHRENVQNLKTQSFAYEYDAEGRITLSRELLNGAFRNEYVYKYDEHGNRIFMSYRGSETLPPEETHYEIEYDSNGRPVSVEKKYGMWVHLMEFVYDDYGNIIKSIYTGDDSIRETYYYYAPVVLMERAEYLKATEDIYREYLPLHYDVYKDVIILKSQYEK